LDDKLGIPRSHTGLWRPRSTPPVGHARELTGRLGSASSGFTTWTVSAKILQRELALPALERAAATKAEHLMIVGRRGISAHDFVPRLTVRALELGRSLHLANIP
jgi:hypothetical protein